MSSCSKAPKLPKSRQRPGGGPWRAFVYLCSARQEAKPKLGDIARQYRKERLANSALYKKACMVGRAGRLMGHKLKSNKSCFGVRQRTLKRAQSRRCKDALWQHTHDLSITDRSHALAAHAQAQKGTLKDGIAAARYQQRMDTLKKKAELEGAMTDLKHFEENFGQQQLRDVIAALPALSEISSSLTPVPMQVGCCFSHAGGREHEVTNGVAWGSLSGKTNVPVALEKEWQYRHATIMHNNIPPSDVKVVDGKKLHKFRNMVKTTMRRAFPGLAATNPLGTGSIVLQFVGCLTTSLSGDHGMDDFAPQEYWFHVSTMYFSPFRPTFHELVTIVDAEETDSALNRVMLQVGVTRTHLNSFTPKS
eukprot:4499515-Amphidinium_carterae.2